MNNWPQANHAPRDLSARVRHRSWAWCWRSSSPWAWCRRRRGFGRLSSRLGGRGCISYRLILTRRSCLSLIVGRLGWWFGLWFVITISQSWLIRLGLRTFFSLDRGCFALFSVYLVDLFIVLLIRSIFIYRWAIYWIDQLSLFSNLSIRTNTHNNFQQTTYYNSL